MRIAGLRGCGSPYLAVQVGEHREDAAVVLGGRRQAELPEDARHVLLDGARCELGDWVVVAVAADELKLVPS